MYFSNFILFSILFFSLLTDKPKDRSIFARPVKIPMALSANFGELRIDHYHSGLDIKTQGVTGKEVFASAAGYVYRISVSPGGFGKALYIRHPSGYSTVYAHLDGFIPALEEYIIERQYEERSYMVTLYPPRDKFRVRQGDLIAYSGNSGSSTGPHLHYEIRQTDSEKPVNPLHFDFGIKDDFKPVIERLAIYPVYHNTVINNKNSPLRLKVSGGNGKYYISDQNEIVIKGSAGFGLRSYDLLNESYNKCSVYSIDLRIDSQLVYSYRMDEFSFDETRYINSHIDYESYAKDNSYYERAFVLPNDRLSVYNNLKNKGIWLFNDGKKHNVEFILTDYHGNRSTLTFHVRAGKPGEQPSNNRDEENHIVMPYGRNNKFVTNNLIVNIPTGTLYDTLFFEYKKSQGGHGAYSDIHRVHNKFIPVHKPYSLSIKPGSYPAGKESKLLIVQMTDDMKKNPLISTYEDGYVKAMAGSFGAFYVGIDTLPPVVSSSGFRDGANMTGLKEMRLRISDNFSGLKTYEPSIDGKWALFEYDQKKGILIYRFDKRRIAKGTKHILTLRVADNKDNYAVYKFSFTW